MNIWYVHAKGKVNEPFFPLRIGSRIYLLLRSGGAISKSLKWLEKEKVFIRHI